MPKIKFDNDAIDINWVVKLGMTKRAYNEISTKCEDFEAAICELSKFKRIIVTPYDGHKSFYLHTRMGLFACSENKTNHDGFSITTFLDNDINSQNKALKNGIIFTLNEGICVDISLNDINCYYKYVNGQKYEFNAYEAENSALSMEAILAEVAKHGGKKRQKSMFEDEYELVEESEQESNFMLLETLKQAEQYALLSSELERMKAQQQGQLSYSEFYPGDYVRVDRVAYVFVVDSIDKNVFKEGVQVEFTDRYGERINGEITDVDIEVDSDNKQKILVTILFNKHFDVDRIESFGFISVSYSDVNKRVQLDAIEKIRNGTAKAKYFADVLGDCTPAGFEDKDLSEVKAKLAAKKYPPNDSQLAAIEKGINSKDVFLVMGPPGTGKTTVILEWVKYFVNVEHKRVLVSSQNNKAVDNVLARLAEEKDIDVIRIGSEAKLQSEVIPYMFENKIKKLNESIDKSTSWSISKLESSVREWKSFRNSLNLIDRQLQDIKQLRTELTDRLNRDYEPFIKQLRELSTAFVQKGKAIEENAVLLNKCEEDLAEYEKQNFLSKMLSKEQYNKNLALREELKKNNITFRKQKNDLARSYNQTLSSYNAVKKGVEDNILARLKRTVQANEKQAAAFDVEVPLPCATGRCFANLVFDRAILKNPDRMTSFMTKLDKEIEKALKLISIETVWRENMVGTQNYSLNEIVLETVDLVGATCIGINSQKRFSNIPFDVTIIDEAGQIQIHNALVPMCVSNKVIMLGDYKQIPPSADDELVGTCELNGVDPELLYKSLFERMYVELPETNKMMLDTQYRMPGEIADIISDWFYNGEYKSPDFKRKLKSIIPKLTPAPFLIIDTSREEARLEKKTEDNGTYNLLEAKICADIIKHVIDEEYDIKLSEIGIISAYKAQVGRIKSAVSKVVDSKVCNEMVATLDSFQGQERDLILYSFTKSSTKDRHMRRIGFLNELRRLNVAMSRCKKTLVMIGDMNFLTSCEHQNEDDRGNKIYDKSEKEFSDFMQKMVGAVKNGKGEIITYEEFVKRNS